MDTEGLKYPEFREKPAAIAEDCDEHAEERAQVTVPVSEDSETDFSSEDKLSEFRTEEIVGTLTAYESTELINYGRESQDVLPVVVVTERIYSESNSTLSADEASEKTTGIDDTMTADKSH